MKENDERDFDDLREVLPHGSGIDYDWEFRRLRDGRVEARNAFHAMDEGGGYCCVNGFRAIVGRKDGRWELEALGLVHRVRHVHNYGLRDYLDETVRASLSWAQWERELAQKEQDHGPV